MLQKKKTKTHENIVLLIRMRNQDGMSCGWGETNDRDQACYLDIWGPLSAVAIHLSNPIGLKEHIGGSPWPP